MNSYFQIRKTKIWNDVLESYDSTPIDVVLVDWN
jgi:hypothetical protein